MEVKRQQNSTVEVLEYRKKSPTCNSMSWKVTLYLTLQSHGLQHARLFCLPLSSKVCSNSDPLSWWCCLTISSSAAPFSSCPLSFQASQSFSSELAVSGSQSIRASASVLPMNFLRLISFRIDWFYLLAVQGYRYSLTVFLYFNFFLSNTIHSVP